MKRFFRENMISTFHFINNLKLSVHERKWVYEYPKLKILVATLVEKVD